MANWGGRTKLTCHCIALLRAGLFQGRGPCVTVLPLKLLATTGSFSLLQRNGRKSTHHQSSSDRFEHAVVPTVARFAFSSPRQCHLSASKHSYSVDALECPIVSSPPPKVFAPD